MTDAIDYYLTVNSPWALFGSAKLRAIRDRYDVPIRVRPAGAGAVFGPSGTLPLAQRPQARQDYRLVEIARWSRKTGLAVKPHPAAFPCDERLAHGAIEASAEAGLDPLLIAEAIGRGLWIEEHNPTDRGDLVVILENAGAPDGEALIARGEEPDIERQLARNAEWALAAGAFGFPWYVFRDEPFWGQDRLDFLADAVEAAQ